MGEAKRHMTPGRLKWMRHLRDYGPDHRTRYQGRCARDCMVLGWTDWAVPTAQGYQGWRQFEWETHRTLEFGRLWKEMITDEGRKMLADADV